MKAVSDSEKDKSYNSYYNNIYQTFESRPISKNGKENLQKPKIVSGIRNKILNGLTSL